MKRIISLMLLFVLCIAFAGCGGNANQKPENLPSSEIGNGEVITPIKPGGNFDVGEGYGDGVGIVCNARNESADGDLIKLALRETFDVSKEILAHVRNYALTRSLKNYRLEIGADERYRENDEVQRNGLIKIGQLKAR